MKRIAVAAVLLVSLVGLARAGFDEGMAAYERGDYATALKEFRPLAEQGNADGQFNLGLMYDLGRGVTQSYAEAWKWYRLAAEQGNAEAQNNLGYMFDNGEGVPQDYAEALKWYRKAAEQGDAVGQYNLGLMYGKGKGVPQDYVQAHMWFNLAAKQGDETGREDRDAIAKRMTPADISKAQAMAREWLETPKWAAEMDALISGYRSKADDDR